jgi:Transposase DDE domain
MSTTANTLVPEQLWQASNRSCRPRHAATAADHGWTTARRWPGSSTSCALASPGGCCPPASLAAAVRSPAGGGCATGSAPACGGSSTPAVGGAQPRRPARLVTGQPGLVERARQTGGELTGPNPTDRGKPGSKYHLLTDRRGIPLAVDLSAANTHDSVLLEQVVDAVAPVKGPSGRPGRSRRRPAKLHLDKGLLLCQAAARSC